MKLILDNGTDVELDYAGSNPEGDMLLLGYDTDHGDVLSVMISLPLIEGARIAVALGLVGEAGGLATWP